MDCENMTNCTTVALSIPGYDTLWIHTTYMIQGSVISASNYLIVLAILRYEALRTSKEYLLMMGLALGDGLNMSGFFFAGVYRAKLVLSGQWVSVVRAWDCMSTPQNVLFSFSQHVASLMLSVISIDRLICVSNPLTYIGLTSTYAWWMILAAYVPAVAVGALGIGLTWHTREMEPDVDARCVTSSGLNDRDVGAAYAWQYKYVPTGFAFASVMLYGVVWFFYRRQNNSSSHEAGGDNNEQLKRQRRFTKSLGICCLCTFFLYCIPYSMAQVFNGLGYRSLPLFCWIISNFNPFCNIFIYSFRHAELKKAIKGLFSNKQMPTDVRMWQVQSAVTQPQSAKPSLKRAMSSKRIHPEAIDMAEIE